MEPSAKLANPIANTLLILFTTILSFGSSTFELILGQTNWEQCNSIIARLLEICLGNEGTPVARSSHAFCRGEPLFGLQNAGRRTSASKSPRSKRAPFEQTGQTIGRSDHSENALIAFTGSGTPAHEQKAHDPGANAYEIKPQKFEEYIKVAKKMADFWLSGP